MTPEQATAFLDENYPLNDFGKGVGAESPSSARRDRGRPKVWTVERFKAEVVAAHPELPAIKKEETKGDRVFLHFERCPGCGTTRGNSAISIGTDKSLFFKCFDDCAMDTPAFLAKFPSAKKGDSSKTRVTRDPRDRNKDELLLMTEAQLREKCQIAADAAGQVHLYSPEHGRYKFDDDVTVSNLLKANMSTNLRKFMMSRGDVERLIVNLRLGDTRTFWEEPPVDRISVANGILNLRTFDLEPHSSDFLYPNQFDVRFDPTATCPNMDKFLATVLDEGEGILFYEILGLLLVPVIDFQTAFLLQGAGSNGKSQFLDMLRYLIGPRNYSSVPLHRLEASLFAGHELIGKLANIEADMSANRLPSSSMFKAIVGGDSVTVERKFCDARSVRLYTRLVFSCNSFPRSSDNSNGFFRRWLVLPFTKKNFDDADASEKIVPSLLLPSLKAEASGILNRAIHAFADVQSRGGFSVSQRMKDAKAEFRALTDSVSTWLARSCILGEENQAIQSDLRNAYNRFCEEKNYPTITAEDFSQKVRAFDSRVQVDKGTHGTYIFRGICLRTDHHIC